jgi:hypothetical protein
MTTRRDIYFPTAIEAVNMIMRMQVRDFESNDEASLTIPTLLEQADRIVNEKKFFIYEDVTSG